MPKGESIGAWVVVIAEILSQEELPQRARNGKRAFADVTASPIGTT